MKAKSATGKNTFQTPADPVGNGSERSQKQIKEARKVDTAAPYSDYNGLDNATGRESAEEKQK